MHFHLAYKYAFEEEKERMSWIMYFQQLQQYIKKYKAHGLKWNFNDEKQHQQQKSERRKQKKEKNKKKNWNRNCKKKTNETNVGYS